MNHTQIHGSQQFSNSGPGQQHSNTGNGNQVTIQRLAGSSYGDTIVDGNAQVQFGDIYNLNVIDGNIDAAKLVREKWKQSEETAKDSFNILHISLLFAGIQARSRNIAAAAPATCQWLREHDTFCQWIECSDQSSSKAPFLWIKGKPGSGKSTLMKQALSWTAELLPGYQVLSYFFNARSPHDLEKSSLGCLRSLAYQTLDALVVNYISDFIHNESVTPIRSALGERANDIRELFLELFGARIVKTGAGKVTGLRDETWTTVELENFLLEIFSRNDLPPFVLYIDALDEGSEDDVRGLVKYLSRLTQVAKARRSKFQVCFSSRHYPFITVPNSTEIVVEKQRGHGNDIKAYVRQQLVNGRNSDMEGLHSQVFEKAGGVFLWAVLVVSMLNKAYDRGQSVGAMKQKLMQTPSQLGDIFGELLSRDEDDLEECMTLLMWVLYSNWTMSPCELYHTIRFSIEGVIPDSSHEVGQDTIERYILTCSRGLCESVSSDERSEDNFWSTQRYNMSPSSPSASPNAPPTFSPHRYANSSHAATERFRHSTLRVQFIHESVRDYLLSTSGPRIGPDLSGEEKDLVFDHDRCHSQLATHCLSYLITKCMGKPYEQALDLQDAFLAYTATQWWKHLHSSQLPRTETQISLVRSLLSDEHTLRIWLNFDDFEAGLIADWDHLRDNALVGRSPGPPLYYAALFGFSDVAFHLMQAGADCNTERGLLGTALHAASFTGSSNTALTLIRHGANVEVEHPDCGTALNVAVYYNHRSTVRVLLSAGAQVNTHGGWGSTLVTAASRGYEDMVTTLVRAGAEVNLITPEYDEPNAISAACSLGNAKIVRVLLEFKADPNFVTLINSCPLLFVAIYRGFHDVVQVLLEYGADPNAHDEDGYTPLSVALRLEDAGHYPGHSQDYDEIVKTLLAYNADPNYIDKGGCTPLPVVIKLTLSTFLTF